MLLTMIKIAIVIVAPKTTAQPISFVKLWWWRAWFDVKIERTEIKNHSVKILVFFWHQDFTWNQMQHILRLKNYHQATKIAKNCSFDSFELPKLISRKIWETKNQFKIPLHSVEISEILSHTFFKKKKKFVKAMDL